MDTRKLSSSPAPETTLDLFADSAHVRDVVRGVLHLIFFHRHFPLIQPTTFDVLDLTLPFCAVPELESLIDSRAYQLSRQLSSSISGTSTGGGGGSGGTSSAAGRGQLAVQFLERRRKPKPAVSMTTNWFGVQIPQLPGTTLGNGRGAGAGGAGMGAEEEVCWETWHLNVTVAAAARSESERHKARRAMETTLQRVALKIMALVNTNKEHIPPITNESAFPYRIVLNPRVEGRGWAR